MSNRQIPVRLRPKDARSLALAILLDIEGRGTFANLALAAMPRDLPARERHLATELVGGVTRWRRYLDFALQGFLKRPLDSLDAPLRAILRLGAYQLLKLTRIPHHAAIHQAVDLARRHGHEGTARMANAVLRRVAAMGAAGPALPEGSVERLAIQESLPDWLAQDWLATMGPVGAAALAAALNRPPPPALRLNLLRTSREEFVAQLAPEVAVRPLLAWLPEALVLEDGLDVADLPGFAAGTCYVQGLGAMLAARVLAPEPGEIIADIGSAPGGKATHLAELTADGARILAVEPNAARARLIGQNADRLGLGAIEVLVQDGREPLPAPCDRILLDAPCSGLGTLYRKADLRWRVTREQAALLAGLQGELLDAAAAALKPGGVLVYATCTIGPTENHDVVAAFVARHPEFRHGDLRPWLPETWHADAGNGMIQLLPHRHGTEGFFIARLLKEPVLAP